MNLNVFQEFPRWRGFVGAGYEVDFLGHLMANRYSGAANIPAGDRSPDYPPADDEIFEWIAVLESVLSAQSTFTMLELGAGYGRWLGRSACAIRAKRPDLKMRLIGVEAEPTHFAWMQEHLQANGVEASACTLIQAPVNGTGAPVHFTVGHAKDWYGQAIIPRGAGFGDWPEAKVVEVLAIPDLIRDIDHVDLIDMDIQGAELPCVESSIGELSRKVGRLFISTHGDKIHKRIYTILKRAGWHCEASYPLQRRHQTEFGEIEFHDGIHYWVNSLTGRRAQTRLGDLLSRVFGSR